MDLIKLTIKETHQGLKEKKFSAVELAKAHLEHAKIIDGKLGSFLNFTEDLALEQARQADELISQKKDFHILTGVPCAIKDAILVRGEKATAGSRILENYKAPYDATVIKKLKSHGAVIVGKTNLDEFAMGASTENSAYKTTRNPHDLSRVAGGSSGGSAAAVAAGQAVYALGSDTGGSIRLPASFCGIVGLNPTYGAVSRYGLVAFASSLDQIGPMAKNVQDCRTVFEAIAGKDPHDATSEDFKFQISNLKLRGVRIGVPREYFAKGIDPDVEKIIKSAIAKAESEGAKIIEISLPSTQYAIACYYIIAPCEASANLARFDGIRYGLSRHDATDLMDVYTKSRGAGFGKEVKRRIIIGTYALSSGYYDAYYKKAQAARELIREDFDKAFGKVDVIMGPVSPSVAFKVGDKANNPLEMYLVDAYTVAVKLAGIPAISMPAGAIGRLPVGLQIIGNYFEENKVLSVAEHMEKLLK